MKSAFATTAIVALLSTSSLAQEGVKVFDAPLKDGKIVVEPRKRLEEIPGGAVTADLMNNKAEQFPVQTWMNQEVYLGKDASGKITSIISVPKGTPITADAMFSSAPAGTVFTKVQGSAIANYFLPSDSEIQAALEHLLATAQIQVCKMKALPKTFEVGVNIQAGAVVEGGVSLSAEWETAELCKFARGG